MITAETLNALTTLSPTALKQALARSGYKDCSFESTKFLGITNGGQFCYRVTYHDDEGEITSGKVFVDYDSANKTTAADF